MGFPVLPWPLRTAASFVAWYVILYILTFSVQYALQAVKIIISSLERNTAALTACL